MKTCLGFGDLDLIFKKIAELNSSILNQRVLYALYMVADICFL